GLGRHRYADEGDHEHDKEIHKVGDEGGPQRDWHEDQEHSPRERLLVDPVQVGTDGPARRRLAPGRHADGGRGQYSGTVFPGDGGREDGMAPDGPGGVIWMRPEHAATGRPARRSREEITVAAIAIADREGLDAVSMRRVAADLGTGAASLYRYVETREDLLDLMIDATGAEYDFAAPTGDWLADVLAIGDQARAIMRHHPWLPSLLLIRAVLGPNGLVLLEHV